MLSRAIWTPIKRALVGEASLSFEKQLDALAATLLADWASIACHFELLLD